MTTDQLKYLLRQRAGSDSHRTGECPDENAMAGFLAEGLAEDEVSAIRRHIAGCDFCLEIVGLLGRSQEAQPPEIAGDLLARARGLTGGRRTTAPARKWRWAAAAAVATGLLLLSVGRMGPTDSTHRAPDMVRGLPTLTAHPEILWPREGAVIPPGRMDQLEVLWTEAPGAVFYQVQLVGADGERLWDSRVETASLRIPAGIRVEAGQQLFIWVRAYLSDGKSLQSEIVGFLVESDDRGPE